MNTESISASEFARRCGYGLGYAQSLLKTGKVPAPEGAI